MSKILESTYTILRPLRLEDAYHIARLLGPDPEAVRMTAQIPEPCTEESAREWIREGLPAEENYVFAIELRDDHDFIGCIGFGGPHEALEVGYWVGKPYRGTGYASEALRIMLGHARTLGRTRLFAETFSGNIASIRVLMKNGFRLISTDMRDFPVRGERKKVERYVVELGNRDGQH